VIRNFLFADFSNTAFLFSGPYFDNKDVFASKAGF